MTFRSPFEIIALPFNLKMWMQIFRPMRMSVSVHVQGNSDEIEVNSTNESSESDIQENHNHYGPLQIAKYRLTALLVLVFYFIALPSTSGLLIRKDGYTAKNYQLQPWEK